MGNNTWVGAVMRFARNRADHMWPTRCTDRASTPDYDIPAFIRRGIRIPALEVFHTSMSSPTGNAVADLAPCVRREE